MFKKKFIENTFKENNRSFRILNDTQTQTIIGGCSKLKSCGHFTGTCDNLTSCSTFEEAQK